ncbi:hypothetical protein [Streptomyces fructofermentans]|uniref:Uncharacterized protein n=1 Tax=Streptomyces fructofermentans TaxID=152141 RepID=A0A918KR20_9ACTN|nr:hypothetical protein [Streptomyces fructofermentans]GGX70241.1 hypothetical protein GCM10010515_42440 [Streptomyces fructofermentans]
MDPIAFPHDLIELQAAWNRTYAALAEPRLSPAAGSAELRRRLVVLSARLWWHPFWSGPGRAPAARARLRSHARALQQGAR